MNATIVSVPFPGILFLNGQEKFIRTSGKYVSVPFPGILFFNNKLQKIQCIRMLSFRPLPGDLISQLTRRNSEKNI